MARSRAPGEPLPRREVKKARRRARREQARRERLRRRLVAWGSTSLALVILVGGLVAFVLTRKNLPPTRFGPAHVETVPPQQVLTTPIPLLVQEHLMEHTCGPGGRFPCVLVQYNCVDYECEPGLVSRLAEIVRRYPGDAYLAPFPGMDAKIALTTFGRLQVLEDLDEEAIVRFIEAARR